MAATTGHPTGVYDGRPWTALYPPDTPLDGGLEHPSSLAAFRAAVEHAPDVVAVQYFDRAISMVELDELSDAAAVGLAELGVAAGDRVALHLQNVPQFVFVLLAAWKLGAVAVPLNPMLRGRELTHQLVDSGSTALVSLDSLYVDVAREVVPSTSVRIVVTTSGVEFQSRRDPRLFTGTEALRPGGTTDLGDLLAQHAGRTPDRHDPDGDEVALLAYTSGTTGPPKGAVTTHGNIQANAQVMRDWMRFGEQTKILGVAPLFHTTGQICQLVPALITPATLVLTFRFEPETMLDAIREHATTFAVGPVTAFIGLTRAASFRREDFASFDRIYSGGAPISPATAQHFEALTGHRLHPAYGMTESTAPSHLAPFGPPCPVDPASGAYAVGIPTPTTVARVVDDDGVEVAPGVEGEIVIESPGVVSGYWNRPAEAAHTIRDGRLFTGDIGVMDEAGWFYLVDRKKDLIICSGYKVWPREVEDVLYEHEAVVEAAVVGVPDDYRGQTVKAFVSLAPGSVVTPAELIAFTGARLAAYKRPADVEILDALPKTLSGKILRRTLRPTP